MTWPFFMTIKFGMLMTLNRWARSGDFSVSTFRTMARPDISAAVRLTSGAAMRHGLHLLALAGHFINDGRHRVDFPIPAGFVNRRNQFVQLLIRCFHPSHHFAALRHHLPTSGHHIWVLSSRGFLGLWMMLTMRLG